MPRKRSDLSRAFSEDGELKTHVGGQALLEGIMMRGRYNWSVAVREPAGTIYTEEHDLASGRPENSWLRWPIVRGCTAFVESLALGYKALEIAAVHAFEGEEDETSDGSEARDAAESVGQELSNLSTVDFTADGSDLEQPFSWQRDFGHPDEIMEALGAQTKLEVVDGPAGDGDSQVDASANSHAADGTAASPTEDTPADEGAEAPREAEGEFGHKEMVLSMVLGVVLGIVLFIVAPAVLTNLIVGEYDHATLAWNLVDGLLRVAVFVFYLWLIGRMKDIQRMFGYHGAEHKTIHCFEHGLPLTPENARSFPRLHVRCGTAFLIMVMIIAILVYTITPINGLIAAWGVPDGAPKLALVILVRILLMPVIAGLSYEITVKWAGSHPENPLVKVVLWPGMQMQYLTTKEPDDGQIECAIAAMQLVLDRENAEEAKQASERMPDDAARTDTADTPESSGRLRARSA